MMGNRNVPRRQFLKLASASMGMVLAACAPTTDKETVVVNEEVTKVVEEVVTAAPAPKAAVTITFVESWFGVPQFQDSMEPVYAEINKRLQDSKLSIQFRGMILDDHANKYPLLYAAGEDITMAFDAPWYQMMTLIDQGYLLPLENLVKDKGPNIVKLQTQPILDANHFRGHLYGIPAYFYFGQTTGVIIREDLRKKYGAPEPKIEEGWASLEPFLVIIKEKEPDMVPFANGDYSLAPNVNGWPNTNWGPPGTPAGLTIPNLWQEQKFANFEDEQWVKDNCDLSRSWWEKGYMNKGLLPMADVQTKMFLAGTCASFLENEPEYKYWDYQRALKESIPAGETMGYDMSGKRAGKVKTVRHLKQWNFVVFNAQAPPDQHEAGIAFFDWLHSSQDNLDLWLFGVDGKNYKREPNMRFSDVPGVDAARNYRRMWYVAGVPGKYQRLDINIPKHAEDVVKFLSTPESFRLNPMEPFEIQTKPIEAELATLNAVTAEAIHGMRTSELPVAEAIKKYKDTLDKAGRQALKAKAQEQMDAWLESNPDKKPTGREQ